MRMMKLGCMTIQDIMQIKQLTIKEIFDNPNFESLSTDYRQESGHAALFGSPNQGRYLQLEASGLLRAAGLVDDLGMLRGLVSIVLTPSLHNSKTIAIVDSLYLSGKQRTGSSLGLDLIRVAQKMAKDAGASGIRFSCPAGSRLEKLFDRLFERSDISYFKSLEE